jgi:hypothetical protein
MNAHVSIEEVHMGETRVDLLGPVKVLQEHLTQELCESVFARGRESERRREWTLHAMAGFWTAVVMRAPTSLRAALDEAYRGAGGYPHVEASPQAFFARSQNLRWEFFRDLFRGFAARALADAPAAFEDEIRRTLPGFTSVWVVDGSRLDAVAHRLKVLWDERIVTLPGSVLVLYDLHRGVPRHVDFCEDALRGEAPLLRERLDDIPEGALLLGDKAYCSHKLLGELSARRISGLVRCTKSIRLEPLERLGRADLDDVRITDQIVLAGTPQKPAERRRLRLITSRRGKKVLRLLTNVLDPALLPAAAALALYRKRWKVERMFYDLKEVLNLHRFYAANSNAVALQLYAAAMVYVAMRIAQARIAQTHALRPEELSTDKLFPRVAVAASAYVTARLAFLAIERANPGVRLVEPDWSRQDWAVASLRSLLLETRSAHRRRRRDCPARRLYASLHRYVPRRGTQS